MAEQNPLTIRASELVRLPLEERLKILKAQAENHAKLKAEAMRRATKVIDLLSRTVEEFHGLWFKTELSQQDFILYAIEALLDADAEEQAKIVAPVVP